MKDLYREGRSLPRKIYEFFYCTVLLVNLLLVLFDATYLWRIPYANMTFRDIYLEYAPDWFHYQYTEEELAKNPDRVHGPPLLLYDPYKGIEKHRFTIEYMKTVKQVEQILAEQGPEDPFPPEALPLLEELRGQSVEMINEDPFTFANKSGTLEIIKNRIRERKGDESAKDSFREFWTEENLSRENRAEAFAFFDREIRPLMSQNYFRWIGEDGQPKDFFHRIDLWFVLFFWVDFLTRWAWSAWRGEHRKWYLFPVRRWYELFLLFPPAHSAIFRLMRFIPFLMRLRDNGFFPDGGVAPELIRENAGVIAEEISGMVMVNIIAQTQSIIKQRGLKDFMTLTEEGALDELQDLLESQSDLISRKVVPEIQPLVAESVKFSIRQSMAPYLNSPIGPAVKAALVNVEKQLDAGLYASLASPEGIQKMNEISKAFIHRLLQEMSREENIAALEKQVLSLLDGVQDQVRIAVSKAPRR